MKRSRPGVFWNACIFWPCMSLAFMVSNPQEVIHHSSHPHSCSHECLHIIHIIMCATTVRPLHFVIHCTNTLIITLYIIYSNSPMNFLINPKHRWIYVFIFPTMAVSLLEGFYFLNSSVLDRNVFSQLFWKVCKYILLSLTK